MPKKKPAQSLRDRIVELRHIPARELQANPGNWRQHPQFQRDVLAATLRDIGVAGALLVYQSERYGGTVIIDGHLRQADYPDQAWPCLVTDLTDAEADLLLAVHDPLTALAQTDAMSYARLLTTVQSGEAALQQFLSEQAGSPPRPYVPNETPQFADRQYTDHDMANTETALQGAYTQKNPDLIEVYCPECAHGFYLVKKDLL